MGDGPDGGRVITQKPIIRQVDQRSLGGCEPGYVRVVSRVLTVTHISSNIQTPLWAVCLTVTGAAPTVQTVLDASVTAFLRQKAGHRDKIGHSRRPEHI